jgi:thymidylate synthase (FAD)
MKIVPMSVEVVYPRNQDDWLFEARLIEREGRLAWRTESKQTDISYTDMIRLLLEHQHESVLEHTRVTVELTTDRGITHELVRHRTGIAFTQESTRYCNYGKKDIEFIEPHFKNRAERDIWRFAMEAAETAYQRLTNDYSVPPQLARSVLPNSLSAKIGITANLRQWRHMFRLRLLGISGPPHPQMRYAMAMIASMFLETGCPGVLLADLHGLRDVIKKTLTSQSN